MLLTLLTILLLFLELSSLILLASMLSLLQDSQLTKQRKQIIPRTRPVRLAARRQQELMAIIAYDNMQDAEWIDEEFLDVSGKLNSHNNNDKVVYFK